jgi:hypothetical protein
MLKRLTKFICTKCFWQTKTLHQLRIVGTKKQKRISSYFPWNPLDGVQSVSYLHASPSLAASFQDRCCLVTQQNASDCRHHLMILKTAAGEAFASLGQHKGHYSNGLQCVVLSHHLPLYWNLLAFHTDCKTNSKIHHQKSNYIIFSSKQKSSSVLLMELAVRHAGTLVYV